MSGAAEEFWNEWIKTDYFGRIEKIKWIVIRIKDEIELMKEGKISIEMVADTLNSYFEDLYNVIKGGE